MKYEKMMLRNFALAVVIIAIAGCTSTVKPTQAIPAVASMDGNVQNSGVIDQLPDGNYVVSSHWHERYCAMQGAFGPRFSPPLAFNYGIEPYTNGTFIATAEAVADFGKMNHWLKNPTPK